MSDALSLFQFFERFPNEETSRLYFEDQRWSGKPTCGHCGSDSVSEVKNHKPMPYRCKTCRKHFSVRTGTVLAESRLPLQKWLMAMYMMTTARKGISSVQMAKELGVTQKTAWFLAQRIRETWMANGDQGPMGDDVQVDETFMGGKEKSKHASKKLHAGRGTVGKAVVVGMRDQYGQVRAEHVANTRKPTLQGFIRQHAPTGARVTTDEAASYVGIEKHGYSHAFVRHSAGEYVRDQAHTNGIESFWALLKRGHYGIYHYMSRKHLHRYIVEFAHRHNTREVSTMDFIAGTITKAAGKRLTYAELISA